MSSGEHWAHCETRVLSELTLCANIKQFVRLTGFCCQMNTQVIFAAIISKININCKYVATLLRLLVIWFLTIAILYISLDSKLR